MKQKFNIITSTCVPLPLENVDTDQIIPARFLKATTREEKFFGDNLFRDWRYNPDGSLNKDFVLNNPTYGGQISVIEYFVEVSVIYQSKQNLLQLENQYQKVMAQIYKSKL